MIIELPVPLENGATHAHIELVNYKMGYVVYGLGTAQSEFSGSRATKSVVGLTLDANAATLIAQAITAIPAKTVIEPESTPDE